MKNGRGLTLFLAGMAVGAIMISPAGAHIGTAVGHLWNDHLKNRVTDLVYTKKQANDRFFRGTYKSYSRPPQETRQTIGGPFSVHCKNDGATIEYEAPEQVRLVLDDGTGYTLAFDRSEGQTQSAPTLDNFTTQVSVWIAEAENSYTRYVVTVTRGVTSCDGTIETIQNPG